MLSQTLGVLLVANLWHQVHGEAMAPPLKYTMKPVAEAYPDFAVRKPPTFNVTVPLDVSAEAAWRAIRDQKTIIPLMKGKVDRMNGTWGDEELIVTWETPTDWHRWHRTDVRKYVTRDDESKTNAFFLCGGFGLWLPRLAFEEIVESQGPTSSVLKVGVWYELDEKFIGWPTDNLKRLTFKRWNTFYSYWYKGAIAYLASIQPPPSPPAEQKTEQKTAEDRVVMLKFS